MKSVFNHLLKFIEELNRINSDVDISDNDNLDELLDDNKPDEPEESKNKQEDED